MPAYCPIRLQTNRRITPGLDALMRRAIAQSMAEGGLMNRLNPLKIKYTQVDAHPSNTNQAAVRLICLYKLVPRLQLGSNIDTR